ncbi:MAG: VWA domain-containing protein [Myxococcales bacterium]|nr:VWA domain-containing protein [Myxococcales bacterium]
MQKTWDWANWPELWWLLPVLGALVLLFIVHALLRRRSHRRLSDIDGFRARLDTSSPVRQWLRFVLVTLAVGLLVASLLRPKYGYRKTVFKNKGIDIVVALDVSRSMLTRDVPPSRIEAVNLEVSTLMTKLQGGRVGLVPFTLLAWVQSPLVSDFNVIRKYLEGLDPKSYKKGGTQIGRAIMQAIDVLTGERQAAKVKSKGGKSKKLRGSKNKVILLFSDGDDHDSNAMEAARKAASKGIRIYTIGVGRVTRVGGKRIASLHCVPDPDNPSGACMTYKGKEVVADLNDGLLKKIAKTTSGGYFHLYRKPVATAIYEKIDKLEKDEYASSERDRKEDRFQLFLLPAFILLLLEGILGDRAFRRRSKEG